MMLDGGVLMETENDRTDESPRTLGTLFWVLNSIIVVGLALMIALPLAGR